MAALCAADFRAVYEGRAIVSGGGTPKDVGRFIASEIVKWQQLATTIGSKAE